MDTITPLVRSFTAARPTRIPALAIALALGAAASPSAQQPATPVDCAVVSRGAGLDPVGSGDLRGSGSSYEARFRTAGMRFEPALGDAASTTQHLTLTPVSVARGGSRAVELPSFAPPQSRCSSH